ncbi:hypothetical protein D3C78_1688810 [compost metagenome]
MLDAVLGFEQGTVEYPDGFGVGEVDAGFAVGVGDHELAQFWAALDQLGKVVATLMAVARVQGRFVWCGHLCVRWKASRATPAPTKSCADLWQRVLPAIASLKSAIVTVRQSAHAAR